MRAFLFAALGGVLLLAACAQREEPLYRWGNYEQLVYDMYLRPGTADPGTQIVKLTEDIERTEVEGKRVPPGVHGHLGYLYYTQGQTDLAYEQFVLERQLFPESAVFVDGIIDRMQQQ
jgi:hypothetical protein